MPTTIRKDIFLQPLALPRAGQTQVAHSNFCFAEGGGGGLAGVVALTVTAIVTVPVTVTALPEVRCYPPAFSHSQLDVFLTCLDLTRGGHGK